MEVKHTEKFSLKDHLFNQEKVEGIANQIKSVFSDFQKEKFIDQVIQKFNELELKERINHISLCLEHYLPNNFREAVEILIRSLPEPCNSHLTDDDFGDFIYAPYNHFVAVYGCTSNNLAFSLQAIEDITTRFSAEDAIRFFINAFPKETMAKMEEWTKHPHYHVRRLASEGSRPKLPWSQKINIDPETAIPILNLLYKDKTRYVTRSVANHLNDISKINPTLVITTLKKWKNEGKQNAKEMDFIIRHALRTLIKNGDKKALELIGIKENPVVDVSVSSLSKRVKMDSHFTFTLELASKEIAHILIDYIIHFQNKNGEMNSKKVFKLKQLELKANEQIEISKKHLMRQFMTTRTLYAGQHMWQLQLNGNVVFEDYFELI